MVHGQRCGDPGECDLLHNVMMSRKPAELNFTDSGCRCDDTCKEDLCNGGDPKGIVITRKRWPREIAEIEKAIKEGERVKKEYEGGKNETEGAKKDEEGTKKEGEEAKNEKEGAKQEEGEVAKKDHGHGKGAKKAAHSQRHHAAKAKSRNDKSKKSGSVMPTTPEGVETATTPKSEAEK